MTLDPGARLGPYEILAPLGAGAMGEVYRASDPRLGREVAIKVLPARFAADPERLQRFEQEARAAGMLNHPNVVTVFDAGEIGGAPYVVQELLEGHTLRTVLAGGALRPRQAAAWAGQIARGLAAAHERGIVHRDLKPENIFVTADEHLKILDFGLAKLAGHGPVAGDSLAPTLTETGVILGTAGYMAPEQVRGEPADARSDLFALGAILHEMLSGERAFRGPTPVETLSAILKDEPAPLPPAVPAPIARLVRQCLEKNPLHRFQSARDLSLALEAMAPDSEIRGAPSVAGAPAPPAARAGITRGRLALLLVPALAMALLAGYLLGLRRPAAGARYQPLTFQRGKIQSARFSADGRTIYFAASWNGLRSDVYTIAPGSAAPQPLGYAHRALASAGTGQLALVLLADTTGTPFGLARRPMGTLELVAPGGEAPRPLLDRGVAADFGPGGALALVRQERGGEVLEYPSGHVLYRTAGWIAQPRVSHDGSQVAFLEHPLWPDDRGTVQVVDRSGRRRVLTREFESLQGLAWSPRGELWFSAADSGGLHMVRAVRLGGGVRDVARMPADVVLEDVAADGRALLRVSRERQGIVGLLAGDAREQEYGESDFCLLKDLAPDGGTLVFEDEGAAAGAFYQTCLRRAGESRAVRLGTGSACRLSPDGQWVLSILPTSPMKLQLIPTGPGTARVLDPGAVVAYLEADWFPDGEHVMFFGQARGQRIRAWVQSIRSGPPRPISAEGLSQPLGAHTLSPDGKWVAARDVQGHWWLVPTADGGARKLPGLASNEVVRRWVDERSVAVSLQGRIPVQLIQVDVTTGARRPWFRIEISDPVGLEGIPLVAVTPDRKHYAYTYLRTLDELYLATGLR